MKKTIITSAKIGAPLGVVLFLIAPLGLGLRLIEVLKPVLAPGAYLLQLSGANTNSSYAMALALILNVCVFTLIVFPILSIRARSQESNKT